MESWWAGSLLPANIGRDITRKVYTVLFMIDSSFLLSRSREQSVHLGAELEADPQVLEPNPVWTPVAICRPVVTGGGVPHAAVG
jgi:hypothetical protein